MHFERHPTMRMDSVIYEPPRPEFPHLMVTFTPNSVDVVTTPNRGTNNHFVTDPPERAEGSDG
jgi:hypothetical protein